MIVAIAVVATLLLSVVAAQGAPLTASSPPPQHWSYSDQKWDNRTSGNGTTAISYSLEAYYGVQDQITATNTSATTVEMMGVQSVVESLQVLGCAPSCNGTPVYELNLSYLGTSNETQYLNFTTNATVNEPAATANATPAVALGITNASSYGQQRLSERSAATFGNWTRVRTLNESATSRFAVSFSPALGLIPWNLSKNLTWSSMSSYVASGGWTESYSATASGHGRSTTRSGNSSGSVNRSGTESVMGKYFVAGPSARTGNRTVSYIGLRYHGPFDFDGRLFMTAIGSDLFAGATSNWTVGAHPAYGNLSPVVATVVAEHATPVGTSGSGPAGPGGTATPPTPGTPPPTGGGAGPGTGSPGAPTPPLGTPNPVSQPTQNGPTVISPNSAPSHVSVLGNLGAFLLPLGALVLLGGVVGIAVVARQRGRGGARP